MTVKKFKYLILGAGPSGLTLANALVMKGVQLDNICVLEKNTYAGGLCHSQIVDGYPLDTGGGHFLDVKNKDVLDFLFHFMPRYEWNEFNRISRIRIKGVEVDHPLEANLWQLPIETQVDYLESIAEAGCIKGENPPESFAAWVRWKLGDLIADNYMLPYNRKIWSIDPDLLGTYWLHKLPSVSFRETLMSCLEGKPKGALPAHGTFLYPKKFGYGEVWRRMGEALGESLVTNCAIEDIDLNTHTINGSWQGETIVSTIPWSFWDDFCELPQEVSAAVKSLKHASINVDYFPDTLSSPAHWIYEPNEEISYHRLLLRSNFVPGAVGFWTESNAARAIKNEGVRFENEYAYPLNMRGKPEAVNKILEWAQNNRIIGLGRWGRWEHMNSDVAVSEALKVSRGLD